ncbi:MAG: carboxylating nicotinate-nucleotide diphosphorylase [Phycisphaerales bacterium]|nr:carboxylating nicotinate-nucleotide diphosphorylase [Phycisphaerales bacterium]
MDAAALLPTGMVAEDLDHWLREDGLETGDVTSEALLGDDSADSWHLVARSPMVVCGLEPLARGLVALQCDVTLMPKAQEGDALEAGGVLGVLAGDRHSALALERTILNILGRACGVATLTRAYVNAVSHQHAVMTDTRKTMPGLRCWDKYAVMCGGGTSHRMGLHDAMLIKDNHLAAHRDDDLGPWLEQAVRQARADHALSFVEVEVDTMAQLDIVLGVSGVDIILLDNMPPDMMRQAVAKRDAIAPNVLLEASGGITLESVRDVAESGVDRIAVGALTRDAVMLDIGLDA